MIVLDKHMKLFLVGAALSMLVLCVIVFLLWPAVTGEPMACDVQSEIGFWFVVYLIVLTLGVVILKAWCDRRKRP